MNKTLKKLLSISLILVSVLGATSSAFAERFYLESEVPIKQRALSVFIDNDILDIDSANIISEAIQYNSFGENQKDFSLVLGLHEWLAKKEIKGANRLLYMIIKNDISLPVDDIYMLINLANQERQCLVKASSRNILTLLGYKSVKEFLTREIFID